MARVRHGRMLLSLASLAPGVWPTRQWQAKSSSDVEEETLSFGRHDTAQRKRTPAERIEVDDARLIERRFRHGFSQQPWCRQRRGPCLMHSAGDC